ncbi:hypothetical protein Vadar_018209 [Vaccinium darrowii]|uniref:Uncharacterized protein n=1 Tax=Vaccinium darrowii TaxID=229202 RepID=A0ACB7YNV0_9ERIC|nr:hypothetical protein Vadar_018209 [Vaccinium darrowii]
MLLDKSGPKIARHKSIYDNLTSAEKSPYIPLHTEDMVYHGIRKCCEINSKGYPTDRSSSHSSLLRPFSENEFDNGIPGNFNLLLKRMKNESVDWDASFNIRATPTHLQDPIWLFWNINVFKAFLERWSPDTNTFHASYGELGFSLWDLHRISGLPILGEFYEEYAPTNDILYSNKISSTCRALFGIYANNNSKKLGHWTSYFVEPNEDSFQRRQNISNDVYLAGFLASWLSGFVLPHSSNSNEVRPSTFVVASKMARGSIFSLAVPVLTCLYQCFNRVAVSSHPGNEPYAPNRYARQFGFGQACPKVVDVSCHAALSSDPPLFYYQWCEMMRRRTNAVIELPSPQFRARVTEPYARWWIASSFVILQFSPDLKRKQPNPQSKTPKKKTKKPTIFDSPYSPPRYSTLPNSTSDLSLLWKKRGSI